MPRSLAFLLLLAALAGRARQATKDAAENPESIKSSYETCNSEADLDNFYISGENIVFHRTPRLPHVIQSMDTDLDISYPITGIRSWLTPLRAEII